MRQDERRVPIWDVPVRLFHWLVVVLVATQFLTAEFDAWELHKLSGYGVLALVLFRIVWGFAGTSTARFASFVRGPAAIRAYARSFWSRTAEHAIGHNPMGALSVVGMLLLLLAQACTGLFAMDTDTGLVSGPLAHLVGDDTAFKFTEVHEFLSGIVQILIGLHVLVILYYAIRKRENLLTPMITGSKRIAASVEVPAMNGYAVRAIIVAAITIAVVVLLVTRL
jgi:cytochrome b